MKIAKLLRGWSWPPDKGTKKLLIIRHSVLLQTEREENPRDCHKHINGKTKRPLEIRNSLRSTEQGKRECTKDAQTKNSYSYTSVRGMIKTLQVWSVLGCLKTSSSSPFDEHKNQLWKNLIQERKMQIASMMQQWDQTDKFAKWFNVDYKFGEILNHIVSVPILPDLQRLICYPVFGRSLKHYFDNKDNLSMSTTQSSNSSMSYEWVRLESFKAFPQTVNVRPIRLAQAGFYYTGTDDKVSCYSCGVSYSKWNISDDPLVVHRRISPQCSHINGGDNQNHPITYSEDNVTTVFPPQRSEQNNSTTSPNVPLSINDNNASFASSNRTDEHRNETPRTSADTASHRPPTNEPIQSQSLNPVYSHQIRHSNEERRPNATEQIKETPNQAGNERNPLTSQPSLANSSLQTKIQTFTHPLGINFEKPKYPAYSVISVRTDTFANWPSQLTQSADDLAAAGFLYAGYSDYVRCFFCGGGLRHWEPGDDPWTEHARWFPRCAFLHQNKGEEFVNMVQQQIQMGELTLNESATERSRNGHPANGQRADAELQSPSAQSLLEMGYSEDLVKRAITDLRGKAGGKTIKASDILDHIFQIEEKETGDFKENKERNSEEIPSLDDETKSMLEENRKLKEQRLCKICLDQDTSIAFLPCGHLCCCPECAPAMRKCPICRTFVKGTVKTWLS